MQIWDTAGQESFRSIVRSYYRGACTCVVVFDVTRRATFMRVRRWIEESTEFGSEQMFLVLVGNKCDLQHRREVSTEEGTQCAEELGCVAYIETSAKTGDGVDAVFSDNVAGRIYKKITDGTIRSDDANSGVSFVQHEFAQLAVDSHHKPRTCCI